MYQLLIIFLADYLILLFGFYMLIRIILLKNRASMIALSSAIIAWVITHIIKFVINDPRPYMIEGVTPLLIDPPTNGSFPSGHTSTAFAMAFAIWMHHRRLGTYLLIVASVIGISRIAAFVHTPIDIIGGIILGCGIAYGVERIIIKSGIQKRISRIDT